MAMSLVRIFSAGVLLCACIGCSQSPKAELVDSAKKFDEWTAILKTVTDRSSYEKAKPELVKFDNFRKERGKRLTKEREDREKLSGPEKGKAEDAQRELRASPEWAAIREATRKWSIEWTRVVSLPEVGELYQKEIMGAKPEKNELDE
jgi:hypothetical protein